MDTPCDFPQLRRRGPVLAPGLLGPEWSMHCQMPTPFLVSPGVLRLYFCSRDRANRSHVFYADFDAAPPWRLREIARRPVLSPGALGTYNAQGVMPTAVVDRGDEVWLYTIGWTVRSDVPYHNAVGLVRSRDRGRTFEHMVPGPVVGTGPNEPYFCGTADVARIGERWVMWYMSATEWRTVAGKPEPRYHLKQAFSDDGVRWRYGESVAVDYLSDDEGGIARATVLPWHGGYCMWFCHRGIADYRGTGARTYRLGSAWSADGTTWERRAAPVFDAPPAADGFDAGMECYPAAFAGRDGVYVFYNGSDFGQTGIGYASLRGEGECR